MHQISNILSIIKHGGGSVMVWSVISYYDVLDLVFIEDNLTGGEYNTILASDLFKFVRKHQMVDFIFM
ncbi:hypothetical protein HERIO_1352 [Hepatospora eriocheir]|uniref:Uncharacterized protein n=1 Tax=Hepatospora eriocheir TaxID=1081669 RepID=A0A1X0QAM1_9MICR|nr:hypothetical protein HERIO_1352 [Hepatospora eriocheir]